MSDPTTPVHGALAALREAMRASPVPPPDILTFAAEACSAAGYPPTTPELDDKLRALGLLFGKAAPGPADLTHYIWHILEGSVPRALTLQALEQAKMFVHKGLAGEQTKAVLEHALADLGGLYGAEMLKSLALILESIAFRAVTMVTDGLQGEVAGERSERVAAMKTIKALEADLTKIAKAYYGEEAPTGVSADAIAEFITEARDLTALAAEVRSEQDALRKGTAEAQRQRDLALSDLEKISDAYLKAAGVDFWTGEAIAEHITAAGKEPAAVVAMVDKLRKATGANGVARLERLVDIAVERITVTDQQNERLEAQLKAAVQAENRADAETCASTSHWRGEALKVLGWDGTAPVAWANKAVTNLGKTLADADKRIASVAKLREEYDALALAICPFPKEHSKLVEQATRSRDRALLECISAMPPGYKIAADTSRYCWTKDGGAGDGSDSPGTTVGLAWQNWIAGLKLIENVDEKTREKQAQVREAHRLNLAELRALLPGHFSADSAQVLRAAINEIEGLTKQAKALRVAERYASRWLKVCALLQIDDEQDPAPALAELRQHVWSTGARVRCKRCSADMREANVLCPGGTPSVAESDDMLRIRDLLHDRRALLASTGRACALADIVKDLIDSLHAAKALLKEQRGKGPSAADTMRDRWDGEKFVAAPAWEAMSDVVWDGKTWIPREPKVPKYGGPGQPALDPAVIAGAVGYPPPMQHPGVLVLTISPGEPSFALWYRLGDKTWCLAQQQLKPMTSGDTVLITIPLGPK